MAKIKLFVDDIRPCPDETWTLARTVSEAISVINTFDFEIISLDHDISHQVIVGQTSRPFPCDETFTPVAIFIAEKYRDKDKKPEIIIHTSNPAGALRMSNILMDFKIKRAEAIIARRDI